MKCKSTYIYFYLIICTLLGFSVDVISQNSSKEFREPFYISYPIRVEQHIEIRNYIEALWDEKIEETLSKFKPDCSSIEEYQNSLYPYRKELEISLGYPPLKIIKNGEITIHKIGEDSYKDIYRIWIEVVENVKAYGIYMVPKGLKDKAPLLIAVHGGGGNPEAICGLDVRSNYHSLGYEAVKRGYIVWAPGLTMFSDYSGDSIVIHRASLDRQLRLVGSSIMGLEIYKIIESVKRLMKEKVEIDKDRVGMTGLSWGAYFTMYTTALSPLIKVAAPSGNFRDTKKELATIFKTNINNSPYSLDGFGQFEAIGMICPRPVMIQMGKFDTVFDINDSRIEVQRASKFYESLGIGNKFIFHEHGGEHEYEVGSILDFFDENL